MSTSAVTLVVGGGSGLVLTAYGIWMLVVKRAPGPTARAFRCARDAGYYHLLFGVGLILVVVGTQLNRSVLTQATALVAIALVGVAVVRFRPRPRRTVDSK